MLVTNRPHVVLVFGGRHYCRVTNEKAASEAEHETACLLQAMDTAHAKRTIDRLVNGGQKGADKASTEWARLRGVPFMEYAVDTALDGPWPGAGPRRNQRMLVAELANLTGGIGFPGGRGTKDMLRRLEGAGVKVWRPYG